MRAGMLLAFLACLAIVGTFVGFLYIWRGTQRRDDPSTIKRRLFSITLACSVSWLPAYFWATRLHQPSPPVHHLLGLRAVGLPRAVLDSLFLFSTLFAGPLVYFVYSLEQQTATRARLPQPAPPPPPPHWRHAAVQLLPVNGVGISITGKEISSGDGGGDDCATGDCADNGGDMAAAARTRTHTNLTSECRQRQRRMLAPAAEEAEQCSNGADDNSLTGTVTARAVGRAEGDAGGDEAGAAAPPPSWLLRLAAGDLVLWRNLVAAPVAEEFVFRACMVPLLVLEGVEFWNVVLLTPLFFGAAHLHHAADLMRHQRKSLKEALIVVGFQFIYTTVFGWLATYLFLRTGHLAAPVAAHVFCNWAGLPPFGDMLAHPRGLLLALITGAGVAAFFLALSRLTSPDRYQQDFYYPHLQHHKIQSSITP